MQLLKCQAKFLDFLNNNRYTITRKSRQIGFTLFLAYWAVRRRLKSTTNLYYMSSCERTAKEMIRYCRIWCTALNLAVNEEVIQITKDTSLTKIIFPNGSTIMAMPQGVDIARGLPGDWVCDEAAIHHNFNEFLTATLPTTQWGHSLIILSSAGLPSSGFEELYSKAAVGDSKFKPLQVDIYEAVRDGLANLIPGEHHKHPPGPERDRTFIEELKKDHTKDSWAAEYECKPQGLGQFIDGDEYDKAAIAPLYDSIYELEKLMLKSKVALGPLTVGIDIGRKRNWTVVWVLERRVDPDNLGNSLENVYFTIRVLIIEKTPYKVQYEQIKTIVEHPQVERVLVDCGGIGSNIAEDLADEFGGIVIPFNFTNVRKGVMSERIKKFLEQDRLALPKDDKLSKIDFMSIQKTVTAGGRLSYEGNAGESHGDLFWGCALALEAAEGDRVDVSVEVGEAQSRSQFAVN